MADYDDDESLFKLMKGSLSSCVIGDVLDKLGFLHQFLPPEIRPLSPDMVLAGRAMTVLEADYYSEVSTEGKGPLSDKPFGLLFQAADDLEPGEIYVASGALGHYAMWGELMSIRAINLRAQGAILNGYTRDTRGILKLDFPTFSFGPYGQDQGARGKVIDWRLPIEIGGVRLESGQILFGDIDGVVAIPRSVEEDVIVMSLEKVRGEKIVAEALIVGMSTAAAFSEFGIM